MLSLKQRDACDPFICATLEPIYMLVKRDCEMEFLGGVADLIDNGIPDDRNVAASDDILKSKFTNEFVGVAVLVATSNDGYVYQFSNNGK